MESKKGLFFAIEGGEGAGKTSCISELSEKYGDAFLYTREPGGTPFGDNTRRLLLTNEDNSDGLHVMTQLLLFFAIRSEHVTKVIRPALLRGKIVICDRFDHSTMAYQIHAERNKHLLRSAKLINDFAKSGVEPDMRILFDVAANVGLERVAQRGDRTTIFDRKHLDFHVTVNKTLHALAKECRGESVIIDANAPKEDVVQEFIRVIEMRAGLLTG